MTHPVVVIVDRVVHCIVGVIYLCVRKDTKLEIQYSPRVYFFTEALAEFQHVNCMIVRIWEVKRVVG